MIYIFILLEFRVLLGMRCLFGSAWALCTLGNSCSADLGPALLVGFIKAIQLSLMVDAYNPSVSIGLPLGA